MRQAGHVACMGDQKSAYKVFMGKPIRRWENNIKMDHREIGWVDGFHLAQGRGQWLGSCG
jgi:hypothetical protein